jgi:hypothetical protein
MGECAVEIGWTENHQPVCFGINLRPTMTGNICAEPDDNFVELGECEIKALTQPESWR